MKNKIPPLFLLALCLSVFSGHTRETAAAQTTSANPDNDAQIYLHWLPQAFGVQVVKDSAGKFSAIPLPELPKMAAQWYRLNGTAGEIPADIPLLALQQGNFLFIEFDFSKAWPQVNYAKRHVLYYLGAERQYAFVADEISGREAGFWTMQLPLPQEAVAVNWDIALRDADRRADLLAGLSGEFDYKPTLNNPVSGYAKGKSGSQMLLARLISTNQEPLKYADVMSPMNIRQIGGDKFLSTEVRSQDPQIRFLVMPYTQYHDELPTAVLSPDTVRLEWYKHTQQIRILPSKTGSLAVMIKEKSGKELGKYAFGTEFVERERPAGELVAEYDFSEMVGDVVKDKISGFDAAVKRGKLVDGLDGKSLYMGYPDHPDRKKIPAGLTIPAKIRQRLAEGNFTISFWHKGPQGQNGDSWAWPIGEALRSSKYLDTGFFEVCHTHYSNSSLTKGFNAAWQIRADSGNMRPGQWHHFVFTVEELDPEKVIYLYEVYIDGVLRTSLELSPLREYKHTKRWDQHEGPLVVGNTWGTYDNLQVYNYPLDEDAVSVLYQMQLEKQIAYYSCDTISPDSEVTSVPVGDYPEDIYRNNQLQKESTFAGQARGGQLIAGVKGKALSTPQGLSIPSKPFKGLSQGAFTISFYFKYSGRGCELINTKLIRLIVQNHKLHGAVGNDWADKFLGDKGLNLTPEKWHHIVLTYDKRSMRCYVDGNLLYDRFMASKDGIHFDDPLVLVKGGTVDEVTLYNYAVGAEEAARLSANLPKE